jgi:hypothetical protein
MGGLQHEPVAATTWADIVNRPTRHPNRPGQGRGGQRLTFVETSLRPCNGAADETRGKD